MSTPFDVFRVEPNKTTVWIAVADSIFQGLEAIRKSGSGKYLIYSQETASKRFYEVTADGKVVFTEQV